MRMVKSLVVAVLLFGAHTVTEAVVWDMEKFLPGERARTHDLVAADGGRLSFNLSGGGAFGHILNPHNIDWQFWNDDGLYYLGGFWNDGSEKFWVVSPGKVVPKFYDDSAEWTTRHFDWLVHTRDNEFVSATPEVVEIEIRPDILPTGEWTIFMRGVVRKSGSGNTESEERWWLSSCIQVTGEATCSPGVRRIQMFYGGSNTPSFERWFEGWVPH